MRKMDLKHVVKVLSSYSPLKYAEKWDNVGLLIEPSAHSVSRIMLTNDLTNSVLNEAIEKKVNLIISYHPPLFASFKRLTQSSVKESIAIRCIEHRIAVYSPHTAIDALKGGVNDWLCRGVAGSEEPNSEVISACKASGGFKIVWDSEKQFEPSFLSELSDDATAVSFPIHRNGEGDAPRFRCELSLTASKLPKISSLLDRHGISDVATFELRESTLRDTGAGRIVHFSPAVTLSVLIDRVKQMTGLKHVRVASTSQGLQQQVSSVALCAGSGTSVLRGVNADCFLTGEASHHDVLSFVESGTSVILTEHSNSERGYIREVYAPFLRKQLTSVEVFVSENDRDPLLVH